jgi:hypothetical protein
VFSKLRTDISSSTLCLSSSSLRPCSAAIASAISRPALYRRSNTLVIKIESGHPRTERLFHCLPASLSGGGNLNFKTLAWLVGKYGIDLTSPSRYKAQYNDLLATILGTRPQPPHLGPPPPGYEPPSHNPPAQQLADFCDYVPSAIFEGRYRNETGHHRNRLFGRGVANRWGERQKLVQRPELSLYTIAGTYEQLLFLLPAFHRYAFANFSIFDPEVECSGLSTDFTRDMRPQSFEKFSIAYARSNHGARQIKTPVRAFWCVRVYQFQPKTAEVEPANCGKQKRPLALTQRGLCLTNFTQRGPPTTDSVATGSIEMRSFVASELVF